MSFIQIIRFGTKDIGQVQALSDKFQDQRNPATAPTRVTVTADRDAPGRYLSIIEFVSYETAMANNDDPSTQEFATAMRELLDAPAEFINLDVLSQITP